MLIRNFPKYVEIGNLLNPHEIATTCPDQSGETQLVPIFSGEGTEVFTETVIFLCAILCENLCFCGQKCVFQLLCTQADQRII